MKKTIVSIVIVLALVGIMSTAAMAQAYSNIVDGGPIYWVGGTTITNPQNGNPGSPTDGSNWNNYYIPATSSIAGLASQGFNMPAVAAGWPPGPNSTYYGMDLIIDDTATTQINANGSEFFNATFNRNSDYTGNFTLFTGGTLSVTTPRTLNVSGLSSSGYDYTTWSSYTNTLTCNVVAGGTLNIYGNQSIGILNVQGAGTVTSQTSGGQGIGIVGLNLQGGNFAADNIGNDLVSAITGSSGTMTVANPDNFGTTFVTSGFNCSAPVIVSCTTPGYNTWAAFDTSASLVGGTLCPQGTG
jgi:hypothetical protein